MTALPKRYFTPEEYLELECRATYKSQYVGGEIFPMGEGEGRDISAMGGAQPEHVTLTTNIASLLHFQFRGRNCRAFSADLRVTTKPGEIYTYPDVTALCGEPKFDATHRLRSLLNPTVIFEVLSPSTEAFDRGDKFGRYRRIDSLMDYVLVSTERMRIEHFVRQETSAWALTEYNQPADRVPLRSVDCELLLEDIYDKVSFSDADEDR